jgi:hypothetical protein
MACNPEPDAASLPGDKPVVRGQESLMRLAADAAEGTR